MCISGIIPLSLLQVGTPDSVRAHAKKLIDVVGKGGGFVMGPGPSWTKQTSNWSRSGSSLQRSTGPT